MVSVVHAYSKQATLNICLPHPHRTQSLIIMHENGADQNKQNASEGSDMLET